MSLVTLLQPSKFGSITIDCLIEESAQDSLAITDHPTEKTADITDHAYKLPVEVTIQAGWSNSSLQAIGGAIQGLLAGGLAGAVAGADHAKETYQKLLALQQTRQPFTVITPRRTYKNMLFRSLARTVDQATGQVLMLTAVCREIILVATQAVTTPPSSVQAAPQKTGAVQNTGTKQPTPVG